MLIRVNCVTEQCAIRSSAKAEPTQDVVAFCLIHCQSEIILNTNLPAYSTYSQYCVLSITELEPVTFVK